MAKAPMRRIAKAVCGTHCTLVIATFGVYGRSSGPHAAKLGLIISILRNQFRRRNGALRKRRVFDSAFHVHGTVPYLRH